MLRDFKLCYKTMVWYWYRNKHIDQRNRIESPKTNPHRYEQFIYHKEAKNKYAMGKDNLFNKWCWENWTAISKRIKLGYYLTSYTKITQWNKT